MRRSFAFLLFLGLSLMVANSATAQTDKSTSYGLLIDNSGSMRSQFDEVLSIGEAIVAQVHKKGPVSIFHFKTEDSTKNPSAVITLGLSSQNQTSLTQYLGSLYIVPGQTTLLDAIDSIAEQLAVTVGRGVGVNEKVIFLVTDGEDRTSKTRLKDVLQKLKESNIRVYSVGLVTELDREGFSRKGSKEKAIKLLHTLAAETNGRAVFSKSGKDEAVSLLSELFVD